MKRVKRDEAARTKAERRQANEQAARAAARIPEVREAGGAYLADITPSPGGPSGLEDDVIEPEELGIALLEDATQVSSRAPEGPDLPPDLPIEEQLHIEEPEEGDGGLGEDEPWADTEEVEPFSRDLIPVVTGEAPVRVNDDGELVEVPVTVEEGQVVLEEGQAATEEGPCGAGPVRSSR